MRISNVNNNIENRSQVKKQNMSFGAFRVIDAQSKVFAEELLGPDFTVAALTKQDGCTCFIESFAGPLEHLGKFLTSEQSKFFSQFETIFFTPKNIIDAANKARGEAPNKMIEFLITTIKNSKQLKTDLETGRELDKILLSIDSTPPEEFKKLKEIKVNAISDQGLD